MTATPLILSIQVGRPKEVAPPPASSGQRAWTTGFEKRVIEGLVRLRKLNFDGDGQADRKHHGGPDKAVCVYPAIHYPRWRDELGVELSNGAFGENLTVAGMNEDGVNIGDVWRIGGARVQVSQPRQPCWKLSRWWGIPDLAVRVQQTGRTGWYLRVLEEGEVEAGAEIVLLERPNSECTVFAANELMHRDKKDLAAAYRMANLPELSASWRATFARRCERQTEPDPRRRLFGMTD